MSEPTIRAYTDVLARAVNAEAELARVRAALDATTEALRGLDEPVSWLAEHYPAAMREMPRDLYGRFAVAHAALYDALAAASGQTGEATERDERLSAKVVPGTLGSPGENGWAWMIFKGDGYTPGDLMGGAGTLPSLAAALRDAADRADSLAVPPVVSGPPQEEPTPLERVREFIGSAPCEFGVEVDGRLIECAEAAQVDGDEATWCWPCGVRAILAAVVSSSAPPAGATTEEADGE